MLYWMLRFLLNGVPVPIWEEEEEEEEEEENSGVCKATRGSFS